MLNIKWQDKIQDTEVMKKAGMQSMNEVLKLSQLRWTGHVISMPDERHSKRTFDIHIIRESSSAAGVVPCGGPKKSPRISSIVQTIFFF